MKPEDYELTEEDLARAKKRNHRYRQAGQHAQASQKKQRVARGTIGKPLKYRIS